MEIGPVLGGQANASQPQVNPGSVLGREDFLELLIAQLQMQDPFQPMDNEEMIAQLAQFSSLEQLQNMNESLQENLDVDLLLGQLINNTMATSLIGKKVMAAAESFELSDDDSAKLGYRLDGNAGAVSVSISDANGALVRTIEGLETTPGVHTFKWDGRDEAGNKVAHGTYRFSVNAEGPGDTLVGSQSLLIGAVKGIRYAGGSAHVLLGDNELFMSEVLEIFEGDIPSGRGTGGSSSEGDVADGSTQRFSQRESIPTIGVPLPPRP